VLRHLDVQSSPVPNQMGGSVFHLELMDVAGCLVIHVLFASVCSLVKKERRREVPSRAGHVARRGWVLRAWQGDGRRTPGCICRMLSVGPQGAATLGNKGAHCLLHRVSQHLNIHHNVRSPAVFCYRKHFKKI